MDSRDKRTSGRNEEENGGTRPEAGVSLKDMIRQLAERKHWHRTKVKLSCSKRSLAHQDVTATPVKGQLLFSKMKSNRDFSRWLTNCWQGPYQVHEFFYSQSTFPSMVAKHFLKRSLCILQQNRGLLTKEDIVSLDVNQVERLLIQSCLR